MDPSSCTILPFPEISENAPWYTPTYYPPVWSGDHGLECRLAHALQWSRELTSGQGRNVYNRRKSDALRLTAPKRNVTDVGPLPPRSGGISKLRCSDPKLFPALLLIRPACVMHVGYASASAENPWEMKPLPVANPPPPLPHPLQPPPQRRSFIIVFREMQISNFARYQSLALVLALTNLVIFCTDGIWEFSSQLVLSFWDLLCRAVNPYRISYRYYFLIWVMRNQRFPSCHIVNIHFEFGACLCRVSLKLSMHEIDAIDYG